jgi:FkbM family methyltransferase
MNNFKKLHHLFLAALSLLRPSRWGVISEIYQTTKFNAPISISYSQGAEDLVLLHFLQKDHGFYIDIGAHHPNRFSVTRQLYDKGWSGLNVDANPDLRKVFLSWRPRDKFLNFAVGSRAEYVFTRFHESAINTVNPEWKDRFIAEGNVIVDEIKVPGISMAKLFEMTPEDKNLDLVNIDIEGGDLEALYSLLENSKLPVRMPDWFLLEAPPGVDNALEHEAIRFVTELGYKPWAIMPMSTLLRRK